MWLLPISIIVFTIVIAIPVSRYMAKIMDGKYKAPRIFGWFENHLNSGAQNWKQYTASLLISNLILFVFGFVLLLLQPLLPLNPDGKGMLAPTTIFHTTVSFMTNTDLQHISGDVHLSNFSQLFFVLTMMFLSASVGFCSLTAIIRAVRSEQYTAGIRPVLPPRITPTTRTRCLNTSVMPRSSPSLICRTVTPNTPRKSPGQCLL